MKLRIAIWASVGAFVVVLWTLYISATSSNPLNPLEPSTPLGIFIYLTCPVALVHHYALSFYFVLLMNAATYALIGTIVETTRRHFKQARLISNSPPTR
jgi:hypothetical protein